MADFAGWVSAAEDYLGWGQGGFLEAYTGNQQDANELALDASTVVPPLRQFVGTNRRWEGTAGALLKVLTALIGEEAAKAREWPKSPNALTGKLRRLAPNLRKVGILVEFFRTQDKKRTWKVLLRQEEKDPDLSSEASEASDGVATECDSYHCGDQFSDGRAKSPDGRADDPARTARPR
jgi:hypothetical protein